MGRLGDDAHRGRPALDPVLFLLIALVTIYRSSEWLLVL